VARVPDAWYVACRSPELERTPVARTILGAPVVLFRDHTGRVGALLDRCAHRNAPLSLGVVDENGRLTCAYHGWRFDGTGSCREVPGLLANRDADGRKRAVPAYASCEQDGFVWVWGRADAEPVGDPVRIPFVDDPDYLVIHREFLFQCTLHAALENALDVLHTSFAHQGDFRGIRERHEVEAVRRRIPNGIEIEYFGEPSLAGPAKDEDGNPILQQHWDRFFMPSVAQVEYKAGETMHVINSLPHTPVSDFETRVWVISCSKVPNGGAATEARPSLEAYLDKILAQDVEILAEQTRCIQRFGGERYMSTELDLVGPEIWRMLRQAERGLAPDTTDIDRRICMTI
jgi:phenylpropionate dioxygenase-like ring-hydroxylating dioxygenase large terminal subunit